MLVFKIIPRVLPYANSVEAGLFDGLAVNCVGVILTIDIEEDDLLGF